MTRSSLGSFGALNSNEPVDSPEGAGVTAGCSAGGVCAGVSGWGFGGGGTGVLLILLLPLSGDGAGLPSMTPLAPSSDPGASKPLLLLFDGPVVWSISRVRRPAGISSCDCGPGGGARRSPGGVVGSVAGGGVAGDS